MGIGEIERVMAFENRFAKAQASEVIELPFGYAVLQDRFPLSHYHNRIVVTEPAPAAEIIAAADRILGELGLAHRFVTVLGDQGGDLAPDLVATGYEHGPVTVMIHPDPSTGRPDPAVTAVSLDAVRPAIIRDWKTEIPDATDEELRQLVDRTTLYEQGAELARLVVRHGDEIAAHADLFLDPVDRIAQFESLVTHGDYRRRGYGSALLNDALWRGHRAGADLFYLSADLDDWPRQWYRRAGFADVATVHHFSRRQT